MLWLKRFHDDHMALVRILPKLEGNLRDIEAGEAGENVIWDLKEFAELLRNVVIPHFIEEEKTVYPKASEVDNDGRQFIAGMYDEHKALYEAFGGFFKSLKGDNRQEEILEQENKPARTISLSGNVNREEVPKNLDKIVEARFLEEKIDKEEVLRHGYQIVQLLREHIEKEETTVAELIRKANERDRV